MTNAPVLDLSVLDGLREIQAELVTQVVEVYLQTAPAEIEQITSAAKSLDAKVLRERAHSLKSASASVGAMAVSILCLDLENQGRSGDLKNPGLPRQVQELRNLYAKTEIELRKILGPKPVSS